LPFYYYFFKYDQDNLYTLKLHSVEWAQVCRQGAQVHQLRRQIRRILLIHDRDLLAARAPDEAAGAGTHPLVFQQGRLQTRRVGTPAHQHTGVAAGRHCAPIAAVAEAAGLVDVIRHVCCVLEMQIKIGLHLCTYLACLQLVFGAFCATVFLCSYS
jgi:hypothetical protein